MTVLRSSVVRQAQSGHVPDVLHSQRLTVRQSWRMVFQASLILMFFGACSTTHMEKPEVITVNLPNMQQVEEEGAQRELEERRRKEAWEAQILATRISELLKLPTSRNGFPFVPRINNPDFNAIVKIGKPAIPHLIQQLDKTPVVDETVVAIVVLGDFGADALEAGPKLKELAETLNGPIRSEALIALSRIGYDPEWTYKTLKYWIHHKPSLDYRTKRPLIHSLAHFDPNKFDVLLTLKHLVRGNHEADPLAALEAFGMLGVHAEPEIPFLLKLKSRTEVIGNENEHVDFIPGAAKEALDNIALAYKAAAPDVVSERVKAQGERFVVNARSSHDAWRDASLILRFIGEPAVPELVRILDVEDAALHSSYVLDSMGQLAVPELVRVMKLRMPDVSDVFDKVLKERTDSAVHFLINLHWAMSLYSLVPIMDSESRVSIRPSFDEILKTAIYSSEDSRSEVSEAFSFIHFAEPMRSFRKLVKLARRTNQLHERQFATWLLHQHATEAIDVLPGLLLCLIDRDSIVRANAAATLKEAGKPGLLILAKALVNPVYPSAFAKTGDNSMMLQALRGRVIAILGEIGDADALPLLEGRFNGPDFGTRELELSAIKQIRSRNKLPPFNTKDARG